MAAKEDADVSNTVQPPTPTTPEIVSVLSEEKRNEYKKLKLKLAKKEQQRGVVVNKKDQSNAGTRNAHAHKVSQGNLKADVIDSKKAGSSNGLPEQRKNVYEENVLKKQKEVLKGANSPSGLKQHRKGQERHEGTVVLFVIFTFFVHLHTGPWYLFFSVYILLFMLTYSSSFKSFITPILFIPFNFLSSKLPSIIFVNKPSP